MGSDLEQYDNISFYWEIEYMIFPITQTILRTVQQEKLMVSLAN